MSVLRPPDDEPVRVAKPRERGGPPVAHVKREDTSPAGLVALAIAVIFAAAGGWVGSHLGEAVPGAIVGGFVGVLAGFAAVYWRWRKW